MKKSIAEVLLGITLIVILPYYMAIYIATSLKIEPRVGAYGYLVFITLYVIIQIMEITKNETERED